MMGREDDEGAPNVLSECREDEGCEPGHMVAIGVAAFIESSLKDRLLADEHALVGGSLSEDCYWVAMTDGSMAYRKLRLTSRFSCLGVGLGKPGDAF